MTQLTKQEWAVRYGALRQLVHNPERKTSGSFARVFYEGDEFIYNQASGRVIAQLRERNGVSQVNLQKKSLYNQILMHLLNDRPHDNGMDIQRAVVTAVGRKMISNEGSPYVAVTRTKQPGVRARKGFGSNWYRRYTAEWEVNHPGASV